MLATLTQANDHFLLKIPSAVIELLGIDPSAPVKMTSDGSRLVISQQPAQRQQVPAISGARTPATSSAGELPENEAMSCRDAAVRVLQEEARALDVYEIKKLVFARKYWTSDGQTPEATIGAALYTEIKTYGPQSRVRKAGRGKFIINEK